MNPNPPRDYPRRLWAWRMATVLGLGCILLYQHTAGFDFVMLDDDVNIVFNPLLGAPTLDRVQWMWTDHEQMRRYIPLGWLGLSVVYAVSGLNPAGYHAAMIALHAVNAMLLFGLLRLQDLGADKKRDAIWPAS